MPPRDHAPLGAPCWIDIMTSDTERTIAFYGDLFGWTCEVGGPEYGGYLNFALDGVPVAGGMVSDGTNGPANIWAIYVAVADAEATVAAATAHGGQVVVPPMPITDLGVMGYVADDGGAAIGLWQPGVFPGFGVLAEPGAPAWFELFTRDYDAALAFYRDVFGWDLHTVGDSPEFRYSTLGGPEEQQAGMMDASAWLPEGVPAHWSVYFATDDTDASLARTAELGGSVVVPAEDTPYGRLATAADATGSIFKLLGPTTS